MKSFLPLLVTLLIQAFSAFALMAVPVLVPVEPGPPRLSTAGIGAYVLFAYVGAVVGSLSAGSMVDRWGAIRTSQGALLVSAAGLVLAALFPGALMIAALLIGLGYGPITPASSHVLIRTTPPERLNLVFSVKQTGVPLGVALSGFCIPPLAAAGWIWTLLILALACGLVAAAAQPVRPALDAQTAPDTTDGVKPGFSARLVLRQLVEPLAVIFQHRGLRTLAAVSFVLSGIQISLSSYLVSYLTQEMALTALVAGLLLGLSQLGGVMGRIVWGFLSDGRVRPLVMLGTLAGVIALASLTTAGLGPVACRAPVRAAGRADGRFWAPRPAAGTASTWLKWARQAPPGTAGKATSGTLALTFLGVIVGAPLFGLIAAQPGGLCRGLRPAGPAGDGRGVAAVRFSAREGSPRKTQLR